MSRELLQRAFEELDDLHRNHGITCASILSDLRKELAKPEPVPVAWMNKHDFEDKECTCPAVAKYTGSSDATVPLYTSPSSQQKPLSHEQIETCIALFLGDDIEDAVEFGIKYAEKYHGIT